mmetsp:Transcript_35103/g.40610  ORF Transcript_35103/g.40610 Transcript_35103/m.40610 type:complete len:215 (+) Transcript_35103:510-1154(+)
MRLILTLTLLILHLPRSPPPLIRRRDILRIALPIGPIVLHVIPAVHVVPEIEGFLHGSPLHSIQGCSIVPSVLLLRAIPPIPRSGAWLVRSTIPSTTTTASRVAFRQQFPILRTIQFFQFGIFLGVTNANPGFFEIARSDRQRQPLVGVGLQTRGYGETGFDGAHAFQYRARIFRFHVIGIFIGYNFLGLLIEVEIAVGAGFELVDFEMFRSDE